MMMHVCHVHPPTNMNYAKDLAALLNKETHTLCRLEKSLARHLMSAHPSRTMERFYRDQLAHKVIYIMDLEVEWNRMCMMQRK